MPSDGEHPGVRVLLGAIRGNKQAMTRVINWALPKLSGTVRNAYEEIETLRRDEWDNESARQRAMDGDVPPEQTIGALSDIQHSLIMVLAYTPAAIMADPEEMEEINDLWTDAVYALLIKLHNPTIKYGIIGGLEPELREPAEEYAERYSREIWGSLLALTSEDPVNAESFPTETGAVIEQVGEYLQRQQQAGD